MAAMFRYGPGNAAARPGKAAGCGDHVLGGHAPAEIRGRRPAIMEPLPPVLRRAPSAGSARGPPTAPPPRWWPGALWRAFPEGWETLTAAPPRRPARGTRPAPHLSPPPAT